ncbi:hypothetical protein ACJX0J_036199, partial [Zea mays]
LLGRRNNDVSDTALRIVASMKRDWMQTRRKPSGLCGAALYIAALSHGCNYTKADIVSVVHVCEATLTKRLIEFENTDSGSLTDLGGDNNVCLMKNILLLFLVNVEVIAPAVIGTTNTAGQMRITAGR